MKVKFDVRQGGKLLEFHHRNFIVWHKRGQFHKINFLEEETVEQIDLPDRSISRSPSSKPRVPDFSVSTHDSDYTGKLMITLIIIAAFR